VEAYAQAVRGLTRLEPALEKQLKYLDFINIYAGLDDNELEQYRRRYPEEAERMTTFAERFREQGMKKGMQQGMRQGMQQGEARVLVRLLQSKFGELPEARRQQIESADAQTLLEWSERALTARTLEEVLH
jgi:flagellar biosynthesis/type III secretory pathway protein FliH